METDNLLLLAPRRVGKSSLLRALLPGPIADGRLPVLADVQDCKTEREFIDAIFGAIHATGPGRRLQPGPVTRWRQRRTSKITSLQIPGGVGVELAPVDHAWQSDADHQFERVLGLDQRWLILVDELPNVIVALADADPTGGRVRDLLTWFRRLRQSTAARDKLRFVLCGSIGLDTVARRHRISHTINDLRTWTLGPFDRLTAERFLDALAVSYGWAFAPDARSHLLHEVEWFIPHHLQGVMGELERTRHHGPIEATHVDAAIEALLNRRNYFNSWDERLTQSMGSPRDVHARTILRSCSRDPLGTTAATLNAALAGDIADPAPRRSTLDELLEVLSGDGYLVEDAERLRFRSSLLRRYWLRHFR